MAGVDAAEQRLHEPVDDLLAESLLDEVADADVAVAEVGRRQHRVHRRTREALRRDHPVEPTQVERDAHQRARHRDEAAAGPEVRRDGRRVHDVVLETDLTCKGDSLGSPVEHRLCTDVDDDAADLGGAQAASDPWRALEHDHIDVRKLQLDPMGCRQTRHSATDDSDDRSAAFRHDDRVAQRNREPIRCHLRPSIMTKKRALVAIPLAVLVGVVALVLVLAGGNGLDGLAESRSDDASGRALVGDTGQEPASDVTGDELNGAIRQTTALDPLSRAVISTGQITLHARNVSTARAEVMRLVTSWNGTVADEQSSSDELGRMADTTMTLRVPTAKFSEALNALGELGEVAKQSRKSEDVTTKVIDNDARVRAAERSIRQIENLLSRAEKLGDIIAIESDLARRQADLDSLKSQQAWLADQTSLSTINVYLSKHGDRSAQEDEARGLPGRPRRRLDGSQGGHRARADRRGRGDPVRGADAAARRTAVAGRTPPLVTVQRRECSCTKCVSRASWSGSVDGMTPWPRLKM